MVPQTPPAERTRHILTPNTPRYAPIYEPDLPRYRKGALPTSSSSGSSSGSKTRPRASSLLTPADTPRKKQIDVIDGLAGSGRVLFPAITPTKGKGSGRVYRVKRAPAVKLETTKDTGVIDEPTDDVFSSRRSTRTKKPSEAPFAIFDDREALKSEDQPLTIDKSTLGHPYHPVTDGRPGMWYVFRGKRVFRPFAPGSEGAEAIRPRRLFQDKEDSEEELTDVEDDNARSHQHAQHAQQRQDRDRARRRLFSN